MRSSNSSITSSSVRAATSSLMSPEPAPLELSLLLADLNLTHLSPLIGGVEPLLELLRREGRQALLAQLKSAGIAKLPERQKLAGALAKHEREAKLAPRPEHTPPSMPPPAGGASTWLEST